MRTTTAFYSTSATTVTGITPNFRNGPWWRSAGCSKLQLPGYGSQGNRTIGQLYNTFLHGAGDKRDHFGDLDMSLPSSIDQKGIIDEWMA